MENKRGKREGKCRLLEPKIWKIFRKLEKKNFQLPPKNYPSTQNKCEIPSFLNKKKNFREVFCAYIDG